MHKEGQRRCKKLHGESQDSCGTGGLCDSYLSNQRSLLRNLESLKFLHLSSLQHQTHIQTSVRAADVRNINEPINLRQTLMYVRFSTPSAADANIFVVMKTLISVIQGLIANRQTPAAKIESKVLKTIFPATDYLKSFL